MSYGRKIMLCKIWSMLLCIAIIVCTPLGRGLIQPAEVLAEGVPALTAGTVTAAPGEVINVPINLTSSGEVVALGFELSYDHSLLTYKQTSLGSGAAGFTIFDYISGNNEAVNLYNMNNTPFTGGTDSTIATMQFTVSSAASSGASCVLGLNGVVLSDALGNEITAKTVNNGQFSIPGIVTGVATPSAINVVIGTALANIGLPGTVIATIGDSSMRNIDVTWDGGTPAYSATTAGAFTFKGSLANLPTGVTNPNNVTVTMTVDVVVTAPVTLSSIAITTPATKLTYTVGDSLDLSGLVVTGTYSDNSTQVETVSVNNVTGFDSSAAAAGQTLTITVGDKTTSYIVEIKASVISQGTATGTTTGETFLTISGDGVTTPVTFTQAQLEGMPQYQRTYSVVNTWPTKKFEVAKGVKLRDLLAQAGIKNDAQLIKFTSKDGYYLTLTVKELLKDKRYYFPHFKENLTADGDGNIRGSSAGAEEVEPIIALVRVEGSDNPAYMNAIDAPVPVYGQRTVTEQINEGFVKYLATIEVSTATPAKWDSPQANPAGGEVPVGAMVKLFNDHMDNDKIYYTTDGSTPTMNSQMYNWIASRWWSARAEDVDSINKPIGPIEKNTTIKAITIGPGKQDSKIATFNYTIPGETTVTTKEDVKLTDNQLADNKTALDKLSAATPEQKQAAQLPPDVPVIMPEAATPTTLTAKDGVQIVVPAGAVRNQTGPVKITVALGTVTAAPQAQSTAVVLDPLKYERQFGVEGQADGSIQFTEP
ncbi:hypothetical protein JT05_07600, partial [Desulfosporosinus sp. Tol-M]